MATKTVASGGGNWSASDTWSPSGKPAAQDDVVFNASSGNVTLDESTALLKSLNMTGYTGTLTVNNSSYNIRVYPSSGTNSVILGGTIPGTNSPDICIDAAYSTINLSFYNSLADGINIIMNASGGSGTINLQSNATLGTGTGVKGSFEFYGGTLNVNGYTINADKFYVPCSNATTVNFGTGAIVSCSYGSSESFVLGSYPNGTVTGTVTVNLNGAGGGRFTGGGFTYSEVRVYTNYTIYDSNTITTFNVYNTPTVTFTAGTTTTVSSFSGSGFTLQSSSSGSYFTLSKSSGTVSVADVSIKDSHATGGATWNATGSSTDVSGNSGWVFGNATIVSLSAQSLTSSLKETSIISDAINILPSSLSLSLTQCQYEPIKAIASTLSVHDPYVYLFDPDNTVSISSLGISMSLQADPESTYTSDCTVDSGCPMCGSLTYDS
jgi:hypothetical protein